MATHKSVQLTYMGVSKLCWGVSNIPHQQWGGVLGDFKGVLSQHWFTALHPIYDKFRALFVITFCWLRAWFAK